MGEFRLAGAYVEARMDRKKLDADIARLQKQNVKLTVKATLDAAAANTRIAALVKARRMKVGVDLDDKAAVASLLKLGKSRVVKATVKLDDKAMTAGLARSTKDRKVKILAELDDKKALTALIKLTKDRKVKIGIDLDQKALAALTGRTYKVKVLAEVNDTKYAAAQRKLDKLTADRTVRILASADTRVAADEIRNLTRRQRVRIGVDVDTRVAADDIANLTRRRMLRVTADADTAAATNSLRFLTRDRRVNIRTSMTGLGGLGSLGGSLGSAGGSAGMLSSRLMMIASAALLATPAVASLGQAIIQMGPAAALAVPALGSLITMGAALGVGLHGVGTAFKSAFETGASSATSAASAARALEAAQINVARSARSLKEAQVDAARQVADAQKRVGDAVKGVRDAEVRASADRKAALRGVTDAERDLADAQKAATQAQEDLNDARKTAVEQLQDLNNRLEDAQLSQRDAVFDVSDAEKDLAAVRAKGGAATADELARAQLTYDKALQRLQEQQLETKRLEEQTAESNAKGVEGSDAVKAAQEGVAAAQRNVGDKARAVGDAQASASQVAKDGADSVRQAQEALGAAQQGVADAQVSASRQVRGAQEALADANRAVATALAQGSTEATKFADAMSKLSPNARSFVEAVKGIAPAWSAVRMDVQDALFKGLSITLTRMSTSVLPAVRGGLVGMGGVLNTMGRELMETFTRLGDDGTLTKMFDGFTNGMKPLAKVPGQIGQAFVQLSVAAAPAFKRLTTAAGGAATRISEQLTKAFKSGHLEEVINQAVGIAKQFGHLIGDIFGTVGNVMKAAAAGGGDALGAIGAVFKELRKITAMPEVQKALTSIFGAINSIAKLLAGTLGAVIMAVLPLLAALAPTVTQLANALGPVLAQLAGALGDALMPIIKALLPVVGIVAKALIDVAKVITPILGPVGELIAVIVAALAPVIGTVLDVIVQLVSALQGPLISVILSLIPTVIQLGQFIAQLAPVVLPLVPAILALLPPMAQLTTALLNLALQVLMPLMPLIVQLAELLAGSLGDAINDMVPILTTVIDWITKFVNIMTDGVKQVVGWFQWMYDTLVGHSIIPDLVKAIVSWFTSLWDKTKKIFTDLKNGVVKIWNDLWSAARAKWDSFYSGLRNSFDSATTWIRNTVSSLRTGVTNTWSSMWSTVSSKATSSLNTIRSKIGEFRTGVTNAFSSLRDGLGKIWAGIQGKLSSPIKWVVGHVYNDGIRKMWNTIAGKISSKIVLPAISLGFNKGGIVPGSGSSDTVPAMLTPNERILSNQQVAHLGGHRGIDAMLGKDRSQGSTGGNPDKRTEQATRHYGNGGIIGTIGDAIGSVGSAIKGGYDWAKDLVIGGLRDAAVKGISSLVRPLINSVPDGGSGWGQLSRGIPSKALDGMLSFLGNEDKKAVGGPGVQHAMSWVKSQNGLPYQWAGNGNPSWDCSGLMSAIESVIRGESPHRRWATGAFSGANAPGGWVRNLMSPFMIGITNAGVGHTAGTIGGMNVESSGGAGVHMGKSARGYNDGMFTDRYGFQPATKYDQGGILPPGLFNGTKRPERVLDAAHTAKLDALLEGAGPGSGTTVQNMNVTVSGTFDFSSPASRRAAAQAMVEEMKEELRLLDKSRAR